MARISTGRKHSIDFLFPIILFLVFAIAAISVILFAARVYQREVESAQKNYNTRTSLEYLTEKVHRSDAQGAVGVGSFGGGDALVLEDSSDDGDARYVTYIYCYEGGLRELYARKGEDVDPSAGTEIIPLQEFHAELAGDHLLRLTCTDADGSSQSTLAAIRSGK